MTVTQKAAADETSRHIPMSIHTMRFRHQDAGLSARKQVCHDMGKQVSLLML